MADTPNTQQNSHVPSQYPSRNIIITGERVARMVQNTVRVSRLETRFIQLSMAPAAVSDAARRTMERFSQACSQFEAELSQLEKEMDSSGRNGQRRRPAKQTKGGNRQTLTRDGSKRNDDATPANAGKAAIKQDGAKQGSDNKARPAEKKQNGNPPQKAGAAAQNASKAGDNNTAKAPAKQASETASESATAPAEVAVVSSPVAASGAPNLTAL